MTAVILSLLMLLAQQRGGRGARGAEFAGPPQGPGDAPIVETLGCLSGTNGGWTLTSATEPQKAGPGFSKADDLKAAEGRPLGSLRLGLIGLIEMHPDQHKDHKVLVKGLLIEDASGRRLNVTSLATVSESCAK
ncbi:MAG TPA: hypothetical protein VG871_19495 [Vicinamibacterales bacterium]|nr:hypothetical protein [Vicinamibacterales bacterium]